MAKSRKSVLEYVEPIGARVVVRKDEPKRETKGGIALPDEAEIPTITGRIVTISAQIENDEDVPLRQYDKILFHPKNAIPVDFEPDNQLFVVPVEDVVAVFRRGAAREPTTELAALFRCRQTVLTARASKHGADRLVVVNPLDRLAQQRGDAQHLDLRDQLARCSAGWCR